VDITHEIPRFDIRRGAFVLASAAPCFPKCTIHLAVVDPAVGSQRKPIIVQTKKSIYVGPDNGLLILAAGIEGVRKVFGITEKRFMRRDISSTFHGRDLFSPVAAHLSKGIRPNEIGKPFKTYLEPSFVNASVKDGFLNFDVLHIDSFGNVVTNARPKDLSAIGARLGSRLRLGNVRFSFLQTYSDVPKGSFLGLVGSHGFFEISANQADAAKLLHLETGRKLRISVTC
jgi:S-adenosylmethionine hydrolase